MIIAKLFGGLGNQMFQYAAGRYLAYKHNTNLKLDITAFKPVEGNPINYYQLNEFNIQENFATVEEVENLPLVKETTFFEFIPEVLNSPDNVVLNGAWQSYKYFGQKAGVSSPIENILRKELTLKNPLGKNSAAWEKKILAAECAVSCHIRRGDYMTPIFRAGSGSIPFAYYYDCINKLKNSCPQISLFVFSDDLNFVKNNFKFDVPVEFVEGCENNYEEIYLMSLCKHNIIANSTFAWWGAWLNKNPDKKIFTPSPWQRGGWMEGEIVPNEWEKIPVDFDENPPYSSTLSIIVHVENNAQTIAFALQSIMSQNMKDFEVIVISSAVDGSDKICRQLAANRNFTFIKTSHLADKYAAFNKGIECARGDYVIFLNGNDFIISNMIVFLAQTLTELFTNQIKGSHQKYISYENFVSEYAPNIFCCTQQIIETEDGNLSIGGVADKKFSIQVDARFQDLKGVTEFSISDRDKMILLATNQLNNSLGTKFFKRNFLNENKIRFDETLMRRGGGSELKFLMDAFMYSEKISFIPQPFFGSLK